MKQFFIIVAAILVSAAIIALANGLYNAKQAKDSITDEENRIDAETSSRNNSPSTNN